MNDKDRKARNLSILSFAIIVYVFAGGSINPNGNFSLLKGSFNLENIHVVRGAVLIVFLFYWYRLNVYTPFPKKLNERISTILSGDGSFINHVHEYSTEVINQKYKNGELLEKKEWNLTPEHNTIEAHRIAFDKNEHSNLYGYRSTIPVRVMFKSGNTNKDSANTRIGIGFWAHKKYLLKTIYRYVNSNHFLNYILPHFLAIIALGCIIYRMFELYS